MLLASAPLREWSLLSSRPTSRAHDRSLRQGDPTRRTKLTDHVPRIHYHCLNPVARSSSIHPLTHSLSIHRLTEDQSTWVEMPGGNHWGHQSMMLDANQELPQHNAKHLPMRTYREISDAPEDVCWFDLQGSIISRVHSTHTLRPRRHGQPPTIGLPEHNHKHEWSTSAQPTGRQRLIDMDKPATYLVAQIIRSTMRWRQTIDL